MNRKHSNSNFPPVIPMSQEKCQRFQLVHPFTCDNFTCMVAGMTGSGTLNFELYFELYFYLNTVNLSDKIILKITIYFDLYKHGLKI